jgi:hypothetical protein
MCERFWTLPETVAILPPGVAMPPSSINVPAQMLNPAINDDAAPPQSVQSISHKNVTINVHEGISAQIVLRSRAQIARAM